MVSPKPFARTAGLLYPIVALFGALIIAYVTVEVSIPSDAANTARTVYTNAGLVGVSVADLLQAACVFLTIMLSELLSDVNKHAARAIAMLVAVATAAICVKLIFRFVALLVATIGTSLGAYGAAGPHALVLILLGLHG